MLEIEVDEGKAYCIKATHGNLEDDGDRASAVRSLRRTDTRSSGVMSTVRTS